MPRNDGVIKMHKKLNIFLFPTQVLQQSFQYIHITIYPLSALENAKTHREKVRAS